MRVNSRLATCITFSAILGSLAITAPVYAGGQEKVLYNFCSATKCVDGSDPTGALIFDQNGNLYSTTMNGGASKGCQQGCGTVFELTPSDGAWTETVLHSFSGKNADGDYPEAGLIQDSGGNLYGTAAYSGDFAAGLVFELIPSDGKWTEKVLYSINGNPYAGLISDSAGNLYGTNGTGGPLEDGGVFELRPDGGKWNEIVLKNFNNKDGSKPLGGVIFDSAGNLYGTTYSGGTYGYGAVYELINTDGKWTEKLLHSFDYNGKDGVYPWSGLIFDSAGNLYGTTYQGGTGTGPDCRYGCGTVFELTPGADGSWTRKILHSFNSQAGDGSNPRTGVILGTDGNLYGTTFYGAPSGYGMVYELTYDNGKWTEKVLHNFTGGVDGGNPMAGLIFDAAGNLYGTASSGGANNGGVVFEITH
jgi:uncharacterized repeat protein (TIGR03803 family)